MVRRPARLLALAVVLVGVAANYLPWTLVPRCTFQYHFFPTVPFIILAAVFLVMRLEERDTAMTFRNG